MKSILNITHINLFRAAAISGFTGVLTVILLIVFPSLASARVTGVCSNCHTMHNSQNGSAVARTGAGTGWNDSGLLTGGSAAVAQPTTLVTDCVGCHSSSTNQTIITTNSSNIPIVYNTVQPALPLAGGNFYWVAQGDDTKGHNVYGINGPDPNLTSGAPGHTNDGCGTGKCHSSLADPPQGSNWQLGGCRGCHVFTYHHEDNGVYRFLKGHGTAQGSSFRSYTKDIVAYPDYVTGVEDDDWEQETDVDHNYYSGTTASYTNEYNSALETQQTITAFCSGCHGDFHGPASGNDGMGDASPWIRHPTDIALPEIDEYTNYNPVTSYSTKAPVAWVTPSVPARSEAIVMCLSCHRAHGSPYPDILRFDYDGMLVGEGCFICHTTKDD